MSQHNPTPELAEQVLDFWFGPLTDGFASAAKRRRWFTPDAVFDREVARRFAALVGDAADGALVHWLGEPRTRLAFILVTDQFSRQIHRGSARAFETDAIALAAARDGIAIGYDQTMVFNERMFFYLPFEHSESPDDQDRSVALFSALFDATPPKHRRLARESLRSAQKHRDIVRQFGRFPHRNAALGRASTVAETEFLRGSGRFGQ